MLIESECNFLCVNFIVGYSLDIFLDFQYEISSSNEFLISRRRSYCCQELDLEFQKDQLYVKVIFQDYDWNIIVIVFVYLYKYSMFLGNINVYEICILNLKFKRIYLVVVQI